MTPGEKTDITLSTLAALYAATHVSKISLTTWALAALRLSFI
jgi:hypothetical protein